MESQDCRNVAVHRRSSRRVVLCDPALPGDLVETLVTSPDTVMAAGAPLQSKGVRRTARLDWAGQHFVLKHYVEPSWRHALKQYVQTSRAARTWNVMHRLADAGVPAPRPVAYIENRWGPFRRDSYLMYPFIEGRTLQSLMSDGLANNAPLRESLWQQFVELWRRLAQLRASLADPNAGNFIISPAGKVWIIDLDKARFHRLASVAARRQQRGWTQVVRRAAKWQTSS